MPDYIYHKAPNRPTIPFLDLPRRYVAALLSLMALLGFARAGLSQSASRDTQARITELFKEARLAERRHDLREAVKLYDDILALDSKLAEVWTNKALILYELSNHREALAAFQKAAALNPRLLTPNFFAGIEYLKLGEPDKAVEPLKLALAVQPHHPQATYELADAYARMEQFELATPLYRDLLKRSPKMEQAWYGLGVCYLNWSRVAGRKLVASQRQSPYGKILLAELEAVGDAPLDAETNYLAAVAAMPDSPEAHLALGRFYLDFQAGPEGIRRAREQFNEAKELDPQNLEVEDALARVALVQGNYAGALAHLEKVIEADAAFARKRIPELALNLSPDALKKVISGALNIPQAEEPQTKAAVAAVLYSAYLQLRDDERAEKSLRDFEGFGRVPARAAARPELRSYSARLKQLERTKLARPLSIAERMDVAVSAWNLGQYDKSLQSLLELLENSPDDQALFWLSRTCRALASETFMKAIKNNPESYRAYLLLADLANDQHDSAKAMAEYEKALSLGAGDPEVHLVFIHFLNAKGRFAEALAKAREAVARFPTNPNLNCETGKLLLRMRNPQEALPYFENSLGADPGLACARAGLADSYAALGDFEKAIREMKQALVADADGSLHYRLGRWYQKAGHAREAQEAFSISSKLKEEKLKKDTERFTALKP